MTLNDFLSAIAGISGLLFVVTSMLAMSLSLSVQQMTQPLKNIKLVILALLANFVLVPLLAFAIIKIIPMDQSLQIGVILLGTAAGAPFIPKLVQGARGNVCNGPQKLDIDNRGSKIQERGPYGKTAHLQSRIQGSCSSRYDFW
jgi:predicted Na+-dependent transporter